MPPCVNATVQKEAEGSGSPRIRRQAYSWSICRAVVVPSNAPFPPFPSFSLPFAQAHGTSAKMHILALYLKYITGCCFCQIDIDIGNLSA